MIITIDGPAASGKSTVAQILANRFSFYYLYTGLLYRAVAYCSMVRYGTFNNVPPEGWSEIVESLVYEYYKGKPIIRVSDIHITNRLYNEFTAQAASVVSANPLVRSYLLEKQRSLAEHHNLVVDGRDCGTVVFPDADVKFFLTADVKIRAQRVYRDSKRESHLSLEEIERQLRERDAHDTRRAHAPLVIPSDAYYLDTSTMTLDETVEVMVAYSEKKLKIQSVNDRAL